MDGATEQELNHLSDPNVLKNDLTYNEQIIYDEENYETESLRLEFVSNNYNGNGNVYQVRLPDEENTCISDLYLIINKSYQIESTINELFNEIQLCLEINGQHTCYISMFLNLIIANLLDKSIKELDDEIKLPLIFFDMNKYDKLVGCKFPLFIYDNIKVGFLKMPKLIDLDARIEYRKYKLKPDINREIYFELYTIMVVGCFTKQRESYLNIQNISVKNPGKLLICYNDDIDDDMTFLEEVHIVNTDPDYDSDYNSDYDFDYDYDYNSGSDSVTYKYKYIDGDIMKLKILGKTAYVISLDPEYKSINKIKNIVKKHNSWNKNNGVNLDRNSKITLKFSNDSTISKMNLCEIRYNIIRFKRNKQNESM